MTLFSKTLLTVSAVAIAASLAFVQPAAALDDQQKKEFGEFIKEYLVEHPEVLLDAQAALEKKQEAARLAQSSQAVTQNKDAIFNSKNDVSIGNPKGDITVVEFFDYNCTYCRHALGDMDTLLKQDTNVRFVLKEFPILGPDSVAASRVSDAFRKLAPEKYAAFHRALLGSDGRASEDSAIEVAGSLGVNESAIRAEMAKSPNTDSVKATYQLATDLNVTGTPAYVIGNETISGAIGLEAIQQKIANVRSCGKTTC
ncbi:DsbA family protein [Rhizobium rhizogenes]|uniref:DsbA family protein n=1 Tax=Rhizobium TaxID=379 RepID=UPI00026EE23E|nr:MULTISPECIES: DsbA family protein [Rhizobium]EJK86318.1 protein-disulfide isomerase [Rhizobium sp. AP16]NTG06965.1 DsbA family protein [Rhizobium rhizogenes]NTG40784.1 DsbA family protein [Rhizobium rhizogenes]NTH76890.1 DsbA family protein [Rhizobium rhizogenes]NTH82898.1 DsbA family protein [Rhizobium rhizogenes]